MKKIFITGGTGFIGKKLCSILHQIPNISCFVLSRSVHADEINQMRFIRGDISDKELLKRVFSEMQPDVLVHFAWDVKQENYADSPENIYWVKWSETLARLFFENGGTSVIASGTCFEYDMTSSVPHREDETPHPNTVYGKCKLETKNRLAGIADAFCGRFVWGRIFYPYGPGEESRKLISAMIDSIGRGERFICRTPAHKIDYIWADDVARIFSRFVLSDEICGTYNVGTGIGTSIRKIGEFIASRLPGNILFETTNEKRIIADTDKLRRIYKDEFCSIQEGLSKMIAEHRMSR